MEGADDMRRLTDLPEGMDVEVDDWGERKAGKVAARPDWAKMPDGRPLHPDHIPVEIEDYVKLYAASVIFVAST